MFSKITLFLPLVVVVGVNAQDSTSTSGVSLPTAGISPCILQCVTQSVTGTSCQSFADFPCVCTDQTFQQNSLACLQANCTAADVAAATRLQQAQCASAGASGSGSSSGAGSATPTVSGSGTQVPPNSSATSPSGTGATSGSGATGGTGGSSSTSGPSAPDSTDSATNSNTGNSAVPVMLTSGPGAAIASIVGVVGLIVGGGLVL